ncbi:MAG: tetratricopeptide repeat protein [Armatimonadetes bacterium]|nr:tetratricopeptide repeat protein [Armatimonadota bacterium]
MPAALVPAASAFNRGEFKKALGLVQDVISGGAATGQAYLLRARCHLALNEEEAAMGDLRRAIEASPDLVEAHVRLARLLSKRGLWQVAAARYQAALDIAPDNREALQGLARLYRDNGHRRRAIELLEAAPSSSSDAGIVLMLADLYAQEGDEAGAQSAYLRAVTLSDGEGKAVALERLGDFYVSIRRHRDALTCYLKAAQLSLNRSTVARRRYEEVMSAADSAVLDEMTASWDAFASYVDDGDGERELVFIRMAQARAHVDEAMRFADSIVPPDELKSQHARRKFAYSLVYEAMVTALSYLDLGGEDMLNRARKRHDEAVAEFERLSGGR